ncbi:hypothetical protein [Caldimicrobium thiodismutans]|uniref:hypothetical protein n=1 Tax=Caldimicrobium thiodismutans TaxID=1653476 RepID=UPI00083832ED|nr:hypothetical protein [Caldimicrobium thiodismutans]
MPGKVFFLKFLPFLVVAIFLRGFFSHIFYNFPLDFFLGFVLGLIPLLTFNFFALLSIVLVSLLKALEENLPSFFWLFYYFFLFWGFFQLKKLFKIETRIFRYSFWGLSVLSFLIIKLFSFFSSLELYTLTYSFWIHLLVKTFFFGLFNWLFIIVFHAFLSKILVSPE